MHSTMTTSPVLLRRLVTFSLLVLLIPTTDAEDADLDIGTVYYPQDSAWVNYFLDDTLIVTYSFVGDKAVLAILCSDVEMKREWQEIFQVSVIPASIGTKAIRLNEQHKQKLPRLPTYICSLSIGASGPSKPYVPQPGAYFELIGQRRSGGPITLGAESAEYSATSAVSVATKPATTATATPVPSLALGENSVVTTTVYVGLNESSPTTCPESEDTCPGPSLSAGAKAGIGVGVVIAIIAMGAVCWFFWRRRRNKEGSQSSKQEQMHEVGGGGWDHTPELP
ncbi:hypothetical protein B0T20DRAFT_100229 [Sordaria brevicollis]|uniref:Mid2 domain-containing protein n=1 Tax=Sordaria brevicollis TaxID=83679 RepID=A0AAE0NVY9_SORBR|nr:hypothetical protein B0T20DRAFT_100229 [Sordaria brevicollis]